MWSQRGQDRFVVEVLGAQTGGFFLDSGASDGVRFSNTLLLESSYGWRGICVEPNERFFAQLVGNRTCVCVQCCLYRDTRTVEFLDAGTLGGIVDCYGPGLLDHARRHGPTSGGPPIATTASMRTRTIRSVLEEYEAPHVIDYWSLDTEGSELAVLDGFPFDEYTVRVLTVEHNWTPMRQEIRELLEARGLKWVRELGCDDAYVAADLVVNPGLPSWRSAAWSRRRR